jgi:glycosyltransferase involved in cell wall biosynthesis
MHVMIVGIRGVPARHGGFETFAEDLSLYLVARHHSVTVYCQTAGIPQASEDEWNGIRRISIPAADSPLSSMGYDWATTVDASRSRGVVLTLGYNTGAFSILYRLRHVPNVMNMDGIEWTREKWSRLERMWLRLNEWAGARCAHHLVADHPEIAVHLRRHTAPDKITVIPYGADAVGGAPADVLADYGLEPKGYYLLVARPEPENSILEIVRACSSPRIERPLVVLGKYSPACNKYHLQVMQAAGPNVRFVGAVYDRERVRALRYHAQAYIHGHRVGGTNPSLVEALAAGNAIIAHDNRFTRWVAGDKARFFHGTADLEEILVSLKSDPRQFVEMEEGSRRRHQRGLIQEQVLSAYEELLLRVERGYR